MKNKKGETSDIIGLDTLIFLILNLIFFVVLLIYVNNIGTRAFIFEESYSKQIALIIDNSKPEMAILLDVSDAVIFAKENNKDLNDIFKINKDKNTVEVSLDKRSYSYGYFSDYDAELKLNGDLLSIIVKENEEEVNGEL